MKILYYDVFCGISGDMNLGALVDLGVDFDYLEKELQKLNIDEEFHLELSRDMKHGISGSKVDVILHNQQGVEQEHNKHIHNGSHQFMHEHKHPKVHSDEHNHNHDNEHSHNHEQKQGEEYQNTHSHIEGAHQHNHLHSEQECNHTHTHNEDNHHHSHKDNHHSHRNFGSIRHMIQSSDLKEKVKCRAIEMFRLVAEAEAKVHGKTIDEVHFHEVGATDSIVDIVGAAICIDALKVDKIMASKVQVGGGFVKCAHGMMPVPAPATVEILKDVPLKFDVVPYETTTPTGAAILKANVNEFSDSKDLNITKIGYGVGNKDFEVPNLLRVYLAENK
ncbi:nickel pincer cofactor biosynthesis protein LarC [Clostridium sp. DL1XJH146]